jgi:hypothetical protein
MLTLTINLTTLNTFTLGVLLSTLINLLINPFIKLLTNPLVDLLINLPSYNKNALANTYLLQIFKASLYVLRLLLY